MCTNSICRCTHHARKCRLVLSGPLSQRIVFGRPRSATIPSSTRVTLRLSKLVSTSSTFAVRIHHAQYSNHSSALHYIVHKIQRPFLVRRRPPSAVVHAHAMFPLLPRDHHPCLPINPTHSLVVHMLSRVAQQNMQSRYAKRGFSRANFASRVRNGSSRRLLW